MCVRMGSRTHVSISQWESDPTLMSPSVHSKMRAMENMNRVFDPRAKYIKVSTVHDIVGNKDTPSRETLSAACPLF